MNALGKNLKIKSLKSVVINDTHIKLPDTLTDKAVKKWSGVPPKATNAILHVSEGLRIKSVS